MPTVSIILFTESEKKKKNENIAIWMLENKNIQIFNTHQLNLHIIYYVHSALLTKFSWKDGARSLNNSKYFYQQLN